MSWFTRFQSSPTPKGGRYLSEAEAGKVKVAVSILAHPERWALQLKIDKQPREPGFQSSPTPKGGRYNP